MKLPNLDYVMTKNCYSSESYKQYTKKKKKRKKLPNLIKNLFWNNDTDDTQFHKEIAEVYY